MLGVVSSIIMLLALIMKSANVRAVANYVATFQVGTTSIPQLPKAKTTMPDQKTNSSVKKIYLRRG